LSAEAPFSAASALVEQALAPPRAAAPEARLPRHAVDGGLAAAQLERQSIPATIREEQFAAPA